VTSTTITIIAATVSPARGIHYDGQVRYTKMTNLKSTRDSN